LTGDANGTGTLQLGDGTNAMTYAGTLDLSSEASSITVLDLKAGGVAVTGAVDLSGTGSATTVTIHMAAGSSITGAITDSANATLATINVDGNATIGPGLPYLPQIQLQLR